MQYSLKLALTLALVLAGNALAEVREITTMSAILPAVDERTLVIFDLDNTLIEPAQSLGSDQWVSMLTKRFVASGTAEPEATDRAVGMFTRIQYRTCIVGIDLSRRPLIATERRTMANGTALYDRGTAYVGPHSNKGRMLATLLADAGLQPARLAFVDR